MTSAPKSASSMVQKGPGRSRDRSKMRTPARAASNWASTFMPHFFSTIPGAGPRHPDPLVFMDIEGPFVEEPLVPQQGNNPPEVPDEGLSVEGPFGYVTGHMVDAQAPVTEVEVVVENVVQRHQDNDADGPEPEISPGIHVPARRQVIEIVVPDKEGDQGETGDFGGVVPQKTGGVALVGRGQVFDHLFHVQPDSREMHTEQGE